MPPMLTIAAVAGLLLLGAVLLAGLRRRQRAALQLLRSQAEQRIAAAAGALDMQGGLVDDLRAQVQRLEAARADWQEAQLRLQTELAQLRQAQASARAEAQDRQALLLQAREQLGQHFTVLAGEIFETRAQAFASQSQASLGSLLTPLRERLAEFQLKVESTYDREAKERFSLQREVERLAQLNAQMHQDAVNLTRALTGDRRIQGTWGERVLEQVLQASGLRPGHEYEAQPRLQRADGSQAQPDILIHLPEGRHVVVDAKMSLTAYTRYVAATSPAEQEPHLRQHLASVRSHVRLLAEKDYQALPGLNSPDFVLIFVPVEPALSLVLDAERDLLFEASQKNILLVSPGTLLATLRTVANLWRQAQQSQNAQDIARQGGALYDKFVGFVTDLDEVGGRLQQAQGAYDAAQSKLGRGKNNLIRQAERLRGLGLKPSKALPAERIDAALEVAQESGAQ